MLVALLRTYLARYRKPLLAVVVLQFVQTMATLYLPSLNADIIDKGIATGDTHYIWTHGALMLGVTLVQVCFAVAAVFFSARAAMGFGRDVRSGLFHQVTGFSAQEVNTFGPPVSVPMWAGDAESVTVPKGKGWSPAQGAGSVKVAVQVVTVGLPEPVTSKSPS